MVCAGYKAVAGISTISAAQTYEKERAVSMFPLPQPDRRLPCTGTSPRYRQHTLLKMNMIFLMLRSQRDRQAKLTEKATKQSPEILQTVRK